MNKKTIRVLLSAFAIVLVAGISFGIAMKLRASDSTGEMDQIMAKKDFEFKGEKFFYVSPNEVDSLYSDKIAYRNADGDYYYFDADTQRLCVIDNTMIMDEKDYSGLTTENVRPYSDGTALLENAKERIEKWINDDEKAQVEWRTETDETGITRIKMCQVLNDEFSVILASALYDTDGDFLFAHINYDSVLDSSDFAAYVSEEEAIEKAKDLLLEEYGESDWRKVVAVEVTGKDGIYWDVKCMKTIGGYAVRVNVLTGETVFYDMLK